MSPIKKLVFADWLLVSRPSFRPVSPKDLTNECGQNTVSDVASNLAQCTLRNKQHQHLNPRTCYQKTYEFLHKSHQHCSVQGQISNFFLPWPCWYSRAPFCRSLMVKSWGNKKTWRGLFRNLSATCLLVSKGFCVFAASADERKLIYGYDIHILI